MKRMDVPHKKIPLLFSALWLGLGAAALQANPYWEEYGGDPVKIVDERDDGRGTLTFVDFEDGRLIAELDGGAGEVSVPVSESLVRNLSLNLDIPDSSEISRIRSEGNFGEALENMRPQVYPLIKFHPVPENFHQLHRAVRRLLGLLIDAGELEEANDLIGRIALDEVSTEYSEIAIRLMNRYLDLEKFQAAADVADSLPVRGDYTVNISPILSAANRLREARHYEALIPLYREMVDAVSEEYRQDIRIWLAYSLVLNDQESEAEKVLEKVEQPAPDSRLFSLYKLLQGTRAYFAEEYREALDTLTRGFVRANTSFDWVPEMLFRIGDCYAKEERYEAARNVWAEINTLYPNSRWSARAGESLKKLPGNASGDNTNET